MITDTASECAQGKPGEDVDNLWTKGEKSLQQLQQTPSNSQTVEVQEQVQEQVMQETLGNAKLFAPSGKEDTAAELQSHVARTQDTLADAAQNAEAVEIKEFDTIVRLETQSIAPMRTRSVESNAQVGRVNKSSKSKCQKASRRAKQALGVLITSARMAPPDVLTGRSVHARLCREVPADHEAHSQTQRQKLQRVPGKKDHGKTQ